MKAPVWLPRIVLVLCVSACGGNDASRYTGSAMDDSAADSAASFTLTIWPRRDTTFGGHLRVGDPVGRSGGVSAWHEGATLKLYSVSADGDTVVWTSAQTGTSIGGTYEVVGGGASGLGGTWRAKLESGPPVSPDALSHALHKVPVPPIDAVWPGIAFALLLAACTRWVRAAPVPTSAALQDPFTVADRSVGGWLAFFVFGQVVGLASLAYGLRDATDFLSADTWELGAAVSGLRGTLVFEKLLRVSRGVAMIVGLRLIATRSRYAPRFWFAFLVMMAAYLVADQVVGSWINEQTTALTGAPPSDHLERQHSRARLANLMSGGVMLLWSMYWCYSSRVRARFGLAALDGAEPLPTAPQAALGD